jgi:hypothetical protein
MVIQLNGVMQDLWILMVMMMNQSPIVGIRDIFINDVVQP